MNPQMSPPGQSLCLHWKHTQKSDLIPDRTHLWIHPACFTLHGCRAHLTLCEYRVFTGFCVFCGRRGPCSVCLKRMQARSLTTQTSCSSLCRECLEHRYTHTHTHTHTHMFTLTSTVEATYKRNLLCLNKYSVY